MKVTRQPDGTMQIEGTAEEVRALLQQPVNAVGTMVVQYPVNLDFARHLEAMLNGSIGANTAAANPLPAWWNTWRA